MMGFLANEGGSGRPDLRTWIFIIENVEFLISRGASAPMSHLLQRPTARSSLSRR
tara:strand:+ start:1350 stop:1514 length:165 start_codon:yes stop_codon:yes gene_type:complete